MNSEELPQNVHEAMKIIQKAGGKKGQMNRKKFNRVCAELRGLGVMMIEDVQIHPWRKDKNGNLFNPWCSEGKGVDAGWNVHSFAPDGQGGGDIIDDDNFDDYATAEAHGKALAEKYGVPFRRRTLFMID